MTQLGSQISPIQVFNLTLPPKIMVLKDASRLVKAARNAGGSSQQAQISQL